MTTQASIIINFYDDPKLCQSWDRKESCNYFCGGYCVLRVVAPKAKIGLNKYLLLKIHENHYLKDPSCKFIWEKSKK